MSEKVELVFKYLLACFQTARIYTVEHPRTKDSIDKAYDSLLDIFADKDELVIGLVGDELAFEKEIFFELSRRMKPMTTVLKNKGIEKITFRRDLQRQELSIFITYLCSDEVAAKYDIQDFLTFNGVHNITAGKIKVSSSEAAAQAQQTAGFLAHYEQSLDKVTQSVSDVLEEDRVDALELRFTMLQIMENLLGRYQEFIKLSILKKHDAGTFSHLLNVAILAMNFASRLGYKKDDCLDIGIAALFHDIGKIYVARKILQKKEQLSAEEFEAIKSHTTLGAYTLLRHSETLGILPIVAAFEHHRGFDGNGYPKLAFPQKPHEVSLLIAICDSYDALMQRRTYKRDYPPRLIFDIMTREKGTKLDSALVDKFFRIMGVWPKGTIVVLSDSRIGIVREQNDNDIFSPKVEIVSNHAEKQLIDIKAEGLSIQRSLNPLAEGKDYLDRL